MSERDKEELWGVFMYFVSIFAIIGFATVFHLY